MLSPRLFDSHEAGSFPLAPLIRKAAAAGQVSAEVHTGEWFDVGTMERLQELQAHLGVLRA
jgi:MurNAc alpha-1-phosphate uridylyltransferase